jgi:aminodeoxyfutalosine deaminase
MDSSLGSLVPPWLAGLPKIELHLHLEGSLRPATLFRLAERNGVELRASSPEELANQYNFTDFGDFAQLFLTGLDVLRSTEDLAEATAALAAELAQQNVRYAEVTTTPGHYRRRGIAGEVYQEGLNEGRRLAWREHGVEIAWICDIERSTEPPASEQTVEFLLGPHAPDGLVALGLGGIEEGFAPELFASSFARAKAAGLGAVPHAGETVGPASIWGALSALKADRIGHGIHCVEDPELMAHLAEHRIPLEVAPSSNVALKIVEDLASHPLGALADAGLKVTLNTDDPAYFQTTLTDELLYAHRLHGFTQSRLRAAQVDALEASFADEATKRRLRRELHAFSSEHS